VTGEVIEPRFFFEIRWRCFFHGEQSIGIVGFACRVDEDEVEDVIRSSQMAVRDEVVVVAVDEWEVVVGGGGDCGLLYVWEVLLGFEEDFVAVLPEDDRVRSEACGGAVVLRFDIGLGEVSDFLVEGVDGVGVVCFDENTVGAESSDGLVYPLSGDADGFGEFFRGERIGEGCDKGEGGVGEDGVEGESWEEDVEFVEFLCKRGSFFLDKDCFPVSLFRGEGVADEFVCGFRGGRR